MCFQGKSALLSIEDRLERLGELLKKKRHSEKDTQFVEGFVTATLVICIGAMAIVGSIEDGLTGNASTLTAKAILDFVIVMVFASCAACADDLSVVLNVFEKEYWNFDGYVYLILKMHYFI